MTGCTPGQLPVLNGIAGDLGVFDHWFCEVMWLGGPRGEQGAERCERGGHVQVGVE